MAEQGRTFIARLDAPTRDALRNHLYTAGELLKANQLTPDREEVPAPEQLQFFEVDDPFVK